LPAQLFVTSALHALPTVTPLHDGMNLNRRTFAAVPHHAELAEAMLAYDNRGRVIIIPVTAIRA
jgi:hypothetical protein